MRFGTTEMLVVLAIVLLLFGAKRIPELMRGMGEGIRSFKAGMHTDESADNSSSSPSVPHASDSKQEKR
jgi:sec-independent protein translocase protein TatA